MVLNYMQDQQISWQIVIIDLKKGNLYLIQYLTIHKKVIRENIIPISIGNRLHSSLLAIS